MIREMKKGISEKGGSVETKEEGGVRISPRA